MNYPGIIGYFKHVRPPKFGYSLLVITFAGLLAACGDSTVTTAPPTTVPPTTVPATTLPPTTVPATTAVVTTSAATTTSAANTSSTTAASTSGAVPDEVKKPFEAASNDLAKRTNLPLQNIQMLGYNREDFSDSSLGCPQPNIRYLQVITPGYQIQLEAGGQQYDYRTNLTGTRVTLCTNPGGFPGPVKTP